MKSPPRLPRALLTTALLLLPGAAGRAQAPSAEAPTQQAPAQPENAAPQPENAPPQTERAPAQEEKAPAQAEQKPAPEAPAAKSTAGPPPPKNLETIPMTEAASLLGKKVRDAAGEDMGMVVDVLVDGYGRPRAAVIDFGGFLGVGSRKIAIDWDLLQFRPGDPTNPVILSLGRVQVQAAPEYKASAQEAQVVGPPLPEGSSAPPDAGK